ncbi:unnamed protein product [Nesidiocoris tenuis]|uniref:AP-3 complex subunit delta domain-containing protein n=1 Tax=Nesidiocoris tenuis TaxID=355587 RepID=A0A6H5FZS8_9HEMI|nr:unnamed protein product [Nesidiocoris tenuis]
MTSNHFGFQISEIVLEKLPQFVNSGDLEVQERACSALELVKNVKSQLEKGETQVVEAVTVLFAGSDKEKKKKKKRKDKGKAKDETSDNDDEIASSKIVPVVKDVHVFSGGEMPDGVDDSGDDGKSENDFDMDDPHRALDINLDEPLKDEERRIRPSHHVIKYSSPSPPELGDKPVKKSKKEKEKKSKSSKSEDYHVRPLGGLESQAVAYLVITNYSRDSLKNIEINVAHTDDVQLINEVFVKTNTQLLLYLFYEKCVHIPDLESENQGFFHHDVRPHLIIRNLKNGDNLCNNHLSISVSSNLNLCRIGMVRKVFDDTAEIEPKTREKKSFSQEPSLLTAYISEAVGVAKIYDLIRSTRCRSVVTTSSVKQFPRSVRREVSMRGDGQVAMGVNRTRHAGASHASRCARLVSHSHNPSQCHHYSRLRQLKSSRPSDRPVRRPVERLSGAYPTMGLRRPRLSARRLSGSYAMGGLRLHVHVDIRRPVSGRQETSERDEAAAKRRAISRQRDGDGPFGSVRQPIAHHELRARRHVLRLVDPVHHCPSLRGHHWQ